MIVHILDYVDNEVSGLHGALVGVIPIARVNTPTILDGGSGMYNLEISVFEIELILDCIF